MAAESPSDAILREAVGVNLAQIEAMGGQSFVDTVVTMFGVGKPPLAAELADDIPEDLKEAVTIGSHRHAVARVTVKGTTFTVAREGSGYSCLFESGNEKAFDDADAETMYCGSTSCTEGVLPKELFPFIRKLSGL